ncbi:hypothetical protein BS47DRAFT_1365861 [Hydnum rufescens UP504]|uniref:Uncharacterized protein n=1 Tax=Hydnum rufescens UP504 TaxID=1448309 RepID=A0A9P6DRN8_9AGAM|nr:hypothetical protein BS47DRAFT_1365861 [Hydnum rufescens UP504]
MQQEWDGIGSTNQCNGTFPHGPGHRIETEKKWKVNKSRTKASGIRIPWMEAKLCHVANCMKGLTQPRIESTIIASLNAITLMHPLEWADLPVNNPTQSLTPLNTPTSSHVLCSTPGRPRSTTMPNSPTKCSKSAAGVEDLTEILNNILAGVTEVRGCLENDVRVIKQQQTETESKMAEMDDHLCALEDIVEAIVYKD